MLLQFDYLENCHYNFMSSPSMPFCRLPVYVDPHCQAVCVHERVYRRVQAACALGGAVAIARGGLRVKMLPNTESGPTIGVAPRLCAHASRAAKTMDRKSRPARRARWAHRFSAEQRRERVHAPCVVREAIAMAHGRGVLGFWPPLLVAVDDEYGLRSAAASGAAGEGGGAGGCPAAAETQAWYGLARSKEVHAS
jgi:hypothetical protein